MAAGKRVEATSDNFIVVGLGAPSYVFLGVTVGPSQAARCRGSDSLEALGNARVECTHALDGHLGEAEACADLFELGSSFKDGGWDIAMQET